MTEAPYKKKLIEVALPLDAINAESAREKSIRHGHPSTLHLWWARRPLAACRAVLFSQLVDDPSAQPDRFPTEEAQDAERERLFKIIEDLVKWENSNNSRVIEAARAEIRSSFKGAPPRLLDPFAGGGSIPLEGQRLGLEAIASDLNPVAVLINRALIQIPPRWKGRSPSHPNSLVRSHWDNCDGLSDDIRRYGKTVCEELQQKIGHLYPQANVNGGSANVIAWIWARTLRCPNPACKSTMVLLSSPWLARKKGKEAWIRLRSRSDGRVQAEVVCSPDAPPAGTAGERGVQCVTCGMTHALDEIRPLAKREGLGSQLVAVVAEGDRRRHYLEPSEEDLAVLEGLAPWGEMPSAPIPDHALGFRVAAYGLENFSDLFTPRQSILMGHLVSAVRHLPERVRSDSLAAGMNPDDADQYAQAITTYVGIAVSRFFGRSSSLCIWLNQPKNEGIANVFTRPTLSLNWDFAEVNPFSTSSGNLLDNFDWVAKVIERSPDAVTAGYALQNDARSVDMGECAVSTDPPYYDNVGYADLSDFFYVPLRQMLSGIQDDLFSTMATPKTAELVSDPARHSSGDEADSFFEAGFREVFANLLSVGASIDAPITIYYAFKQSEKTVSGLTSTGWSTILEALVSSGWAVTATWPIRTERPGRMRANNSNALATSVVLACRPRPSGATISDRGGLIRALKAELPHPLKTLQKASIAPVDLRQAAIGPGMAVFSRFSRVVEADGTAMKVKTLLEIINGVLDELLTEQDAEFDIESRWAVQWFSQYSFDEGPYGVAEQLATAMNIAVEQMQRSGMIKSGGGKVRLLSREEYPALWDPRADPTKGTSVWEATHHLVKLLEEDGEAAAARLLDVLGGIGDACRALAYRLYTISEKSRPGIAGPYNAIAASWTEMQRIAAASEPSSGNSGEQQVFDV